MPLIYLFNNNNCDFSNSKKEEEKRTTKRKRTTERWCLDGVVPQAPGEPAVELVEVTPPERTHRLPAQLMRHLLKTGGSGEMRAGQRRDRERERGAEREEKKG